MLQHHIFSAFARCERNQKGVKALDLSVAQFKLLMTVRRQGEITLRDLAAMLEVSPPSASVMVEKLAERKLLIRERSREDRRKVVIHVSPDEARYLDTVEQQVLTALVNLLNEVGPETAGKWRDALARVEETLLRRQQGGGSVPRGNAAASLQNTARDNQNKQDGERRFNRR